MFDWLKGKFGKTAARKKAMIDADIICDILDKVDDTSLLVSVEGDILFANEHFMRHYGVTEVDTHKYKIYDAHLGCTTEARFRYIVNEARRNGGKIVYDREMKDVENVMRFMHVSAIIYQKDDREYLWYFAKDMTELKQRQVELRELNQMLNVIIDNLPVYLFVKDVDDDLRYLYWNKAFEQYSGIPASKVIGNTDFEVFPDYNDALMFREDDMKVVKTGQNINKHETYVAVGGNSRIVQTFKTLVKREGRGPLLIGLSMDITNLQDIEQELIRERLRAEESDRLKSCFLANMSHEIRTPLNAIVGFASLLTDAEDAEMRREFSEIINQNSEILLQLINDILDLSKIEAGTLEYTRQPMDLLDTCRSIYMVHKDKVHPGVQLIFDNECMQGKFMINEDRNRIVQVIDNLLNNAAKFTSTGEIRYGFGVKGDWIEIYVKDTGIGIPADKQKDVFDRFVKLDSFSQGTGLGLPICKLIAETLGGNIVLESEEGKGSLFRFNIPYKKEVKVENEGRQQPVQKKKAVGNGDRTILVAEDVPSNYLVVKALIKGRYNLVWAHNGKEAVLLFKEKTPDLVLMDIKMPEMNGLEATRQIRLLNIDVPIVALTANAFDNDRAISLNAGMNDFLPKPIDRDQFENILATYL